MPKQPIVSVQRVASNISILYVVGSIVFVVTLGLLAAVFIAERTLTQDIAALNVQLIDARNSFELATIAELKQVSARTSIANDILNRHIATSKFLEALEESTFTKVSFSSLAAETTDTQTMNVTLKGIAESYNTLILQKDLFAEVPFLTQSKFSNFSLGDDGSVSFSFTGSIDSKLIDYKRYLSEN